MSVQLKQLAIRTVPVSCGNQLFIGSEGGLQLQFTGTGIPVCVRHGPLLINQLVTDPMDGGLFRLLVRERSAGVVTAWGPAVGAGARFNKLEEETTWAGSPAEGLDCVATIRVHQESGSWAWVVSVANRSQQPREVDAVLGQDIGLNDASAIRRNEAFNSQYVDFNPVEHPQWGWVLLVRQNQRTMAGNNPFLLMACPGGSTGYCTDGWQFFGTSHRRSGVPAAATEARLASQKLQYECSYGALQSTPVLIQPGEEKRISFVLRFIEHHPSASSLEDLDLLDEVPAFWVGPMPTCPSVESESAGSLFLDAPWLQGEEPGEADWDRWFPGQYRHVERDGGGRILSFFCSDETHVVSSRKEAGVMRPHGHLLRSGDYSYPDAGQFGITCSAAGVFASQAYLGNPSMARLLSVMRNSLNVVRSSGQRIFVKIGGQWQQLGIPSAFAMTTQTVRWIYRHGEVEIWIQSSCLHDKPASILDVCVAAGGPTEFLVTHRLSLGAEEGEGPARVEINRQQALCIATPSPDSVGARHEPGLCYAIALIDPEAVADAGGDELAEGGKARDNASYFILKTKPVCECRILLAGSCDGRQALLELINNLRTREAPIPSMGRPIAAPLGLTGAADPGLARINEILPWFNHNAAIHFSAPHGLEQYEGGAWGVRDVCQGSMEWLLASGHNDIARQVLLEVFSHQYATDGSWPQWFMHPPYGDFQQLHCHGDVCFWPVKAVCDYIEATSDFRILEEPVPYTDPDSYTCAGPSESILHHCDRVVRQYEQRCLNGTALVNYGDGDWDDTLQPADPVLRTHMVSAWTVGLTYHTFRLLAGICRRRGDSVRAERLEQFLRRMGCDLRSRLMPDGILAGFLIHDEQGDRWLLHPRDKLTGVQYRLLPMTRAILAELFDAEEMRWHLELIRRELLFADGVRLMSEPVRYHGGVERLFKRGETAANVGREIGLMYVHAHIRYAEALAKIGDAEGLWRALQVINPVGIREILPQAEERQANVFYSSSDAAFADRAEASKRWDELRAGKVAVRGGWRLYSSGPGLFINLVRSSLLGIRCSFGDVVFDPVLPRSLDGLEAELRMLGHVVKCRYTIRDGSFAPKSVAVNGTPVSSVSRDPNPYREGGLRVRASDLETLLDRDFNTISIGI